MSIKPYVEKIEAEKGILFIGYSNGEQLFLSADHIIGFTKMISGTHRVKTTTESYSLPFEKDEDAPDFRDLLLKLKDLKRWVHQ